MLHFISNKSYKDECLTTNYINFILLIHQYCLYIHTLLVHQNVYKTVAALNKSSLLEIYWRSSDLERWKYWFLFRSWSSKREGLAAALFPIATIYGYPVFFALSRRFPIVISVRSSIITLSQKPGICWINVYNSSLTFPTIFSSLLPAWK